MFCEKGLFHGFEPVLVLRRVQALVLGLDPAQLGFQPDELGVIVGTFNRW